MRLLIRLIIIAVPLAVLIAGVMFISAKLQQVKLTIEFNNIERVEIQQADDNKIVKTVTSSGESISLAKGEYLLSYTASEGYAYNEIGVNLKADKEVTIAPYFSDSRLQSLLENEQESINQVLAEKYPSINLYKQEGRLYHFGDWYGAKLIYTGSDVFNSDGLRVVLKKDSGAWEVVTQPPDITLSKFIYKNIPVDILREVNKL